MAKYETNPLKIRKKFIDTIKEEISLDTFNKLEQKIVLQMIQACGDTSILEQIRFSDDVVKKTLDALEEDFDLLCDSEKVTCGVKQKYLTEEPICLINKASVISQAKSSKQTRSMTAVNLWKPYLSGSIIIIGNEPTALYQLLALLKELEDNEKPALIIATPVGFIGASESKQLLWEQHKDLGVPCITLLGFKGGTDISTTIINTLLKIKAD